MKRDTVYCVNVDRPVQSCRLSLSEDLAVQFRPLLCIAKGKANKDIGEILGLSPRTVNKHLEQIFVKLGVENRASAAVRAAEVIYAL